MRSPRTKDWLVSWTGKIERKKNTPILLPSSAVKRTPHFVLNERVTIDDDGDGDGVNAHANMGNVIFVQFAMVDAMAHSYYIELLAGCCCCCYCCCCWLLQMAATCVHDTSEHNAEMCSTATVHWTFSRQRMQCRVCVCVLVHGTSPSEIARRRWRGQQQQADFIECAAWHNKTLCPETY